MKFDVSDLISFIVIFILVYVLYFFVITGSKKKKNRDKYPIELLIIIEMYRLDIKKINYKSIMNKISLAIAFEFSFTSIFIFKFINSNLLCILVGILMLIPLTVIFFRLIGKSYVRKGCVIDGNK